MRQIWAYLTVKVELRMLVTLANNCYDLLMNVNMRLLSQFRLFSIGDMNM